MSCANTFKTTPIQDEYYVVCNDVKLVAGTGFSGGVVRCTRIVDGAPCALKFLQYCDNSLGEIAAWRACTPHPNIVALVDVFDTGVLPAGHPLLGAQMQVGKRLLQPRAPGRYLIAVMEDMAGGDMFDAVMSNVLSERTVREIVAQALAGLYHIHACGFVHCDIKIENMLLRQPLSSGIQLALCDFGFARSSMLPFGRSYTRAYIAPETIDSFDAQAVSGHFLPVGPSCDVWAVGVCAYILMGRKMPFFTNPREQGANDDRTLTPFLRQQIAEGVFAPLAAYFSSAAHSFVRNLLEPIPEMRLTALQALQHPWMEMCATARDAVAAATLLRAAQSSTGSTDLTGEPMPQPTEDAPEGNCVVASQFGDHAHMVLC